MNSTNNNSFEIAAKKVFSDLYALIKEDENKIDNNKKDNKNVKSNKKDNKIVISNKIDDKNVISNEIDDKPKPFNLLDLDNDILNIIGDFVKKDNEEREEEIVNSEQTINGKIIMFRNFVVVTLPNH
jgi:glycerol-3-phosphate cytidylyltransferase-like family protein